MKQLVQSVRSGALRLVDAPTPEIGATEVLVQTEHSLISSGTERAVRQLASASLLSKARARPDLVRKVIQKARTDGIGDALSTVRNRLSDEMPLGYSAAGVVLEVGDAVAGIRPGMRVATGGAGHGELQVVAGLLCAPLPDRVSSAHAAFATIASIGLHGIRQAELEPGSELAVVGLGLIGQLTLRMASALGYRAIGIDVDEWAVRQARIAGFEALVESGASTTDAVQRWSRLGGVDAVILTASTRSSEPVKRSVEILRDRGEIVVVGDVGLELERTPLYEKEITIRLARSYGPGRYMRSYEDWGVDLPASYVRWTEGRNLSAVLDMIASGRLEVGSLVTHSFDFADVERAYALIEERPEPILGVRLDYSPPEPTPHVPARSRRTRQPFPRKADGVAFIGAGNFASGVLLPNMKKAGFKDFVSVASATGVSAERLARSGGFRKGAMTVDQILDDPDVGVIVVATPHDTHAELTVQALDSGRHVFCEKPVALSMEELERVEEAWRGSDRQLFIGFNRRFSPAVQMAMQKLRGSGPRQIVYRVNAGKIDESHWYKDRRQGGRLLGEGCHFVDTCCALVDAPVRSAEATIPEHGEPLLVDDFTISLSFEDGSLATIMYSSAGHPGTSKEWIEILGAGHTITIDDYRMFTIDSDVVWKGKQNKGHSAECDTFLAITSSLTLNELTSAMLTSTALTLAASNSQTMTTGPLVSSSENLTEPKAQR